MGTVEEEDREVAEVDKNHADATDISPAAAPAAAAAAAVSKTDVDEDEKEQEAEVHHSTGRERAKEVEEAEGAEEPWSSAKSVKCGGFKQQEDKEARKRDKKRRIM